MIDSICKTLAAYEEINHGCDHSAEFELLPLPDASNLEAALESHFANQYTSISPPRPASDWHMKLVALETPVKTLHASLRRWLLENRPSDNNESPNGLPDVSQLMSHFSDAFEMICVVAVTVRPPLWYACEWEDFAFSGSDGFYLLHLGYSD